MDGSIDAKEAQRKPSCEIIPDGSECFQCGRLAKGTAATWLYRKNPATGKRERYKPHPKPKRYFYCDCGRKWNRFIPKSQIRTNRFIHETNRPAQIDIAP